MKPSHQSGNLQQKLSAYVVAAGAALLAAAPAKASVVYSDLSDAFSLSTATGTVGESHYWDIDGGGMNDFIFDHGIGLSSWIVGRGFPFTNHSNLWVKPGAASSVAVQGLAIGNTVGPLLPNSRFGDRALGPRGYFITSDNIHTYLAAGNNYVGFKFKIGADLHFGWANVSLEPSGFTMNWWAYETTPNTAITVGPYAAVPEPSVTGLALLALGAAGVKELRRRRTAKA